MKLIFNIQKNEENYTKIILFAPDKIKIKRETLSEYQLKIADLYNIPNGNFKKLVSNFPDKEKYVLYCENLEL